MTLTPSISKETEEYITTITPQQKEFYKKHTFKLIQKYVNFIERIDNFNISSEIKDNLHIFSLDFNLVLFKNKVLHKLEFSSYFSDMTFVRFNSDYPLELLIERRIENDADLYLKLGELNKFVIGGFTIYKIFNSFDTSKLSTKKKEYDNFSIFETPIKIEDKDLTLKFKILNSVCKGIKKLPTVLLLNYLVIDEFNGEYRLMRYAL